MAKSGIAQPIPVLTPSPAFPNIPTQTDIYSSFPLTYSHGNLMDLVADSPVIKFCPFLCIQSLQEYSISCFPKEENQTFPARIGPERAELPSQQLLMLIKPHKNLSALLQPARSFCPQIRALDSNQFWFLWAQIPALPFRQPLANLGWMEISWIQCFGVFFVDASSKDNTTKPWGIWACHPKSALSSLYVQGHERLILLCLKYILISIISR